MEAGHPYHRDHRLTIQITARSSLDLGIILRNQHTGLSSNNCVSIAYSRNWERMRWSQRSDLSDDFLQILLSICKTAHHSWNKKARCIRTGLYPLSVENVALYTATETQRNLKKSKICGWQKHQWQNRLLDGVYVHQMTLKMSSHVFNIQFWSHQLELTCLHLRKRQWHLYHGIHVSSIATKTPTGRNPIMNKKGQNR